MQQRLDGGGHDEQSNDKAIDIPVRIAQEPAHIMEQQAAGGGSDKSGSERNEFDATEYGGRMLTLRCEGGIVGWVAWLRFGGMQDETAVGGVVDVPRDYSGDERSQWVFERNPRTRTNP